MPNTMSSLTPPASLKCIFGLWLTMSGGPDITTCGPYGTGRRKTPIAASKRAILAGASRQFCGHPRAVRSPGISNCISIIDLTFC